MTITTIADIVRTHGRERPDAPALEFDGRTITFGELDARSNQLAQALAAAGVGSGDRVAFLDKNGPEFFEVDVRAREAQRGERGVNWRLAPAEIADIVNDAARRGRDRRARVRRPRSRRSRPSSRRCRRSSRSAATPAGATTRRCSPRATPTDPGASRRATTSRSSSTRRARPGLPKGVMLTNDNFFKGVMHVTEPWRFTPDSVNLAMMPMFHIAGAGWSMVGLVHGCQTVLLRDVDPARILGSIPEFGVTNAFIVPAVIQFLLMTPGVDETDFSTLRALVYGASPITDTVLAKAMETFGCEFIQVYGLTETTGAITQLDADDHDPRAGPSCCARAASRTRGSRCASSTPRRARTSPSARSASCGRAPARTCSATGNDDATRAAITDDGWFNTGDAGYRDADGFLFLHDRVKDMIVSGGENIYPAEVENVLAKHPDVADVAVIGVPDERWGEAVKAIVVPREERDHVARPTSSRSRASTSPATSCRSRSTSPTCCPATRRASCSSASSARPTGRAPTARSADPHGALRGYGRRRRIPRRRRVGAACATQGSGRRSAR